MARFLSMAALTALFAFTAITPTSAQTNTTVRINDYPGIGNPMARILVDEKLCEKHGITCTLQVIPSASLAVQALVGGSIDVASAGADSGILAASRGMKLKVLGNALADTNFFLAVGKHVDLDKAQAGYAPVMQRLRGKKIGVAARGSPAEYQFVALAQGAGMQRNDFTIVAVGGPDTAYPALLHKQVDALLAFEPIAAFCEVLDQCIVAVDMRKGQGPADLIKLNGAAAPNFIRAEFAEQNPAVVKALITALKEAESYYTDPAKWQTVVDITAKRFPINNPNANAIIDRALNSTKESVRFKLDPNALQAMADFLFNTDQLSQPFDTTALLLDAGTGTIK